MNNTSLILKDKIKFLVVTVSLFILFVLGIFFGMGYFNTAHADDFSSLSSRAMLTRDTYTDINNTDDILSKVYSYLVKEFGLNYEFTMFGWSDTNREPLVELRTYYVYVIDPLKTDFKGVLSKGSYDADVVKLNGYLCSFTLNDGKIMIHDKSSSSTVTDKSMEICKLNNLTVTSVNTWVSTKPFLNHVGGALPYRPWGKVIPPIPEDDIQDIIGNIDWGIDNVIPLRYMSNTQSGVNLISFFYNMHGKDTVTAIPYLNGTQLYSEDFEWVDLPNEKIGTYEGSEVHYNNIAFQFKTEKKGLNVFKLVVYNEKNQIETSVSFTFDNTKPDSGNIGDSKPDKPNVGDYPDTVLGFLKYLFDTLMYYILMPFKYINSWLKEVINTIQDFIKGTDGLGSYISSLFNSFPSWVITPLKMIFSITCLMVVFRIIGR